MNNEFELFTEVFNIIEENQKYKELINKIKYYIPIVGAYSLWFYICIGILAG